MKNPSVSSKFMPNRNGVLFLPAAFILSIILLQVLNILCWWCEFICLLYLVR